ncbi:MAG TPA: hypothetical protein VFF98_14830 [Novosphingobium sp.]|nr:hypothetical protein [Novosphingobium sp.]HZV09484.1 hypothetical protein [Novosphingobium sp.]
MAIKIFGLTILTSTELASVKSFALSEATKAVAALKETPVGTAIANAISDIDNANLTGIQKFEKVLSDTLPQLQQLLTAQGLKAELADLEDLGRSLVQTIYNDFKSTTAGTWATSILKLLGISA